MKLLLDEDSEARVLVKRLVNAGHNVTTVGEMGQRGEPDEAVLRLAKQAGRVLLTRNCTDFRRLHDATPDHAGILAVYQERNPRKDMTYNDIVNAIGIVEDAGSSLMGAFICLNGQRG